MFRCATRCCRNPLLIALLLCTSLHAVSVEAARLGPGLQEQLAALGSAETAQVIVTFHGDTITPGHVELVRSLGISRGVSFQSLPIMGVLATRAQVEALAGRAEVRSLWPNLRLQYDNFEATSLTGVQRARTDATFRGRNGGVPLTGRGIGVLINDSGVDGLHQDHEWGPHVVENVLGATNLHAYDSLLPITWTEGVPDTDLGSGHGTHVAASSARPARSRAANTRAWRREPTSSAMAPARPSSSSTRWADSTTPYPTTSALASG